MCGRVLIVCALFVLNRGFSTIGYLIVFWCTAVSWWVGFVKLLGI